MSKRKTQPAPQPNFNGRGALVMKPDLAQGVMRLEGPMTTLAGESVRIEVIGNKTLGWSAKVKNAPEKGIQGHEPWDFLGAFEFKSFAGKQSAQRVTIPCVGKALIYPGKTQLGDLCMRVQQLIPAGERRAADVF